MIGMYAADSLGLLFAFVDGVSLDEDGKFRINNLQKIREVPKEDWYSKMKKNPEMKVRALLCHTFAPRQDAARAPRGPRRGMSEGVGYAF